MFSKLKLTLQRNQKLVCGMNKLSFSTLKTVISEYRSAMRMRKKEKKNVEISKDYLPLCFASFQFIRDNFHAINNQQSLGIVIDNKEDNETIDQDFLVSQLQLSVPIKINDQMTQESSIPLCFEPFQILKEMWYNIFKEKDEKLVEVYEVPWNPICHRL